MRSRVKSARIMYEVVRHVNLDTIMAGIDAEISEQAIHRGDAGQHLRRVSFHAGSPDGDMRKKDSEASVAVGRNDHVSASANFLQNVFHPAFIIKTPINALLDNDKVFRRWV